MTVRRIARWAAMSLATVSIGLAGVATASGNGGGTDKPGKGCGDRNHVHYKEGSCHSKGDGHHNDGRHHDDGSQHKERG
jgi:hypothetical protein